jgi:two-component system NarL family sensor kinase
MTRSPVERPRIGALPVAMVRLALVPVALSAEALVDHPTTGSMPLALGAFAAWALLAVAVHGRSGPARARACLTRAEPVVDLAAIVALVYTSGGTFAQTAMASFVLPVIATAHMRPVSTMRWAATVVAAYLALSLARPSAGADAAIGRLVAQAVYLGWLGLAASILSVVLARRDATIAGLAEERDDLAAHALRSAQEERRRLADLLHDQSVQTLSLAKHELVDYRRTGRDASFERARAAVQETIEQLRGQIFELHPYVLDHAGMPGALRAITDSYGQRMGAEVTVAVDPSAPADHDELLVALARELLANAARHSGAGHVVVSVAADAERIELEVRDDGVGFDDARRAQALREGHIGLASVDHRVRALGGELQVTSAPGAGTVVRALLPCAPASRARPPFAGLRALTAPPRG